MRLTRVVVDVPDLDRAVAFYERAFGLRALEAWERSRWRIDRSVELDAGGGVTLALAGTPASQVRYDRERPSVGDVPAFSLTFVVPDVEAAVDRAIAAGAVAETGVDTELDGQQTCWLRDIFGNAVQLISAP